MWGTPAKVKGTLRFCQTPKPQRPIAQEPCNSSGHGLATRPAPPSAVPARLHPAFRFIDAAQPGHLIMSCCQGLQPTTPQLARTPASTRFITAKAPVSQQELQPVQNLSLIPAGKNFHQPYVPAAPERSIRWLARTLSSTTSHGFTTAPETPEATLRCIDAPKPADPSATSQKL